MSNHIYDTDLRPDLLEQLHKQMRRHLIDEQLFFSLQRSALGHLCPKEPE